MKKENYIKDLNIKNQLFTDLKSEIRFKTYKRPCPNTALVVVDIQNYFTKEDSPAFLPASKEILPWISNAISHFSAAGSPIYFTKHVDRSPDSPMIRFWRGKIVPESLLSQIDSMIDANAGTIIEKSSYDAFYETDLESSLLSAGVDRLFFCGAVAHLCVESTVRSAFVRGFDCCVLGDAVADYNYEAHFASLRALGHGFASIAFLEDLF